MRYFWLFFLFLIPAAHAQATPEFCAMIKDRHSVHYTPGIDVHGKKVVSADLNNDFSKSLFPIEIPIKIDLIERFDLDIGNGIDLEPVIAHFQVHEDGRVMYGDKDLTNKAQELCTLPEPITKPTIEINYNE